MIDDSGDRKDGTKTAHVGHQWLGRSGKTGNGVVTVTTVWADERLYYPVHAEPCTSARGRALARSLTVVKPGGLVIGLAGPPDPGFAKEIGASSLLRGHDFS